MGYNYFFRTILASIIVAPLIIQISAEKSLVNETSSNNEAYSNDGNKTTTSTNSPMPTKALLSNDSTKGNLEPPVVISAVSTTKLTKITEKESLSKSSITFIPVALGTSVATKIDKSTNPAATKQAYKTLPPTTPAKPFTKPSTPGLTSEAPKKTTKTINTITRKTCKKGLSCPKSQTCIDRSSESICICSASKTKKGDKCLDTPTTATFALKLLANFNEELIDSSSLEFISLAEKIEKAIDPLMKKIKAYDSVQVQSFISGSTVANVIVKFSKKMESENAISATQNIINKAIKSGDLDSLGVDKTSSVIAVPYSENGDVEATKIPLTKTPGEESNKTVVIVVVILLIIFVIVVIIVVLYCRKKTKGVTKVPTDDEEVPLEEA